MTLRPSHLRAIPASLVALALVSGLASGCCFGGTTTTSSDDLPVLGTAPADPAPAAAGTQSVSLAPGFAAQSFSGTAGGTVMASTFHESCRGYVTTAPSFEVTLTGALPLLTIQASSERDTTMVIQRPDGTYSCNDDFAGLNPGFSEPFGAGVYRVWVGTYSPDATGSAYSITFSPDAPNLGY